MSATAYVVERPIINDVQRVRWLGYARGKSHAFLIPEGPLESPTGDGKIVPVCGKSLDVARLAGDDQRCKTCVTAMAEDTRKRGTGLSERTVDHVDTGAQDGAPREAEARRAAEIALISGDAAEVNASIGEQLALGDRQGAVATARELDARGPAAAIPEAVRAPIGNRDHGMLDGVAMVKGANMPPVQRMWRNPVTGVKEPAAGRLDGSLNERPDRDASTVPLHGGKYGYLTRGQYDALSRSQQRKYWDKIKKQTAYVNARRKAGPGRRPQVVPTGTGGIGSRSFAEGDACETERVMQEVPRRK